MAYDSTSHAAKDLNHPLSNSSPQVILIGKMVTPLGLPPWFRKPAPPAEEHVPEENLEQILSKSPARKVAQFRVACKYWNSLTSTSHFINMHTKHWAQNYLSEILIQKNGSLHSIIFENLPSSSPLTSPRIVGSCGEKVVSFSSLGFLVMRDKNIESCSCEILNPATKEKVMLLVKDEEAYLQGQIYAIFLHPKLQEECVLWGQRDRLNPKNTTEFQLLNLKSALKSGGSCWRKIVPRLHNYIPRNRSNRLVAPVMFNNVLYWMISTARGEVSCEDAILAFDVEREEFKKLPHPGPFCAGLDEYDMHTVHENMHLLQTNGQDLSVCQFSGMDDYINTWEMRCGEWIRKYRVESHELTNIWPSFNVFCYRVLGMVNQELVLLVNRGTGELYVVNLKSCAVEKLKVEAGLHEPSFVCAYMQALATMTSGKGEILVQVPTSVRAIKRLRGVIY